MYCIVSCTIHMYIPVDKLMAFVCAYLFLKYIFIFTHFTRPADAEMIVFRMHRTKNENKLYPNYDHLNAERHTFFD